MKSAAENITDITLELGGKSPLVVFPDADLEQAVQTTITAIFFNTGECCCAGSRLFVHEDVKTEFLDELAAAAEDLTVDDPLLESTDLGPKVPRSRSSGRWATSRRQNYKGLPSRLGLVSRTTRHLRTGASSLRRSLTRLTTSTTQSRRKSSARYKRCSRGATTMR